MVIDGLTSTRLANGLQVVLKPSRVAPVASFWVWYRVGSRNEGPGLTGVSHWVEHMLFKGTERYPRGEFDKAVARAGVLDEQGQPVAGAYEFAQVVRDGLVVDFVGAVELLRRLKQQVEAQLGEELTAAASAYPPGVPQAEVRATANVLYAAGLECTGLIDEPSAAKTCCACAMAPSSTWAAAPPASP